MSILIKNGRIIDPALKWDKVSDMLIENGKIAKIGTGIAAKTDETIDAGGKIVCPGFVDLHTHLREPGREDKETVDTGTRAAIAGGFTTVCAMPNTDPACDNQSVVKFILAKAAAANLANVLPVGAITKGRAGKEMTEMMELKEAGCLAVSDDGDSVSDPGVMRRAMEYASMAGLVVMAHCEDKALAKDGVMHEGLWSSVLGLKPQPAIAESLIVERDIELAKISGAKLHISHVSAKESVEIIREAKKRGINVTAETTPHHFTLKDEDLKGYDTNYKVNPPLRGAEDIAAIKNALKEGVIDAIATDHAPHLESEKEKEFDFAPFGMIGLETALSLAVTELVEKNILDWPGLIAKLASNPCRILGYSRGTIAEGAVADVTIIDPSKEWVFRKEDIKSKSSNSPFIGRKMKAVVTDVIVGGRTVLRDRKFVS